MKKTINIIFSILCLFIFVNAKIITVPNSCSNQVKIENLTYNSIVVTFDIAEIQSQTIFNEGKEFSSISIDDYSTLKKVGKPALPAYKLSMAINDGAIIKTEIIEEKIEVLEDINVFPYLGEVKIKPEGDEFPEFTLDNNIYNSNINYPTTFVDGPSIHKHRGISIADFQITPFSYNSKFKKLKIYTHLKLKISFDGGSRNANLDLPKEQLPVLTNTTNNGKEFIKSMTRNSRSIIDDDVDDILIITIPEFLEAAESLASWQKMKGYNVKIEAKSWSSSIVKSTVNDFYEQTNPKPSFLVIIGDVEQVPTNMFYEAISNSEMMGSDLPYVCMDGSSDLDPDMAKGRISVTTANEANGAIQKIIDYELKPPMDENYYKNILACTYFQGSSTSQMNFTASIERSASYLEDMNIYDINRIYYTSSSNYPTTYGSMAPDAGKPVPSYLRKPGFPWDGNANDIIAGMNAGSFFAFHYDHGEDAGWSSPAFKVNDVSRLSNVGKYPIVNSINCYSGSFHENLCFAEKMIRVSNSGAAGIFAATIWTLTGSNNEIQQTFVNSIWPGLKSNGEPVYMMADVVDQCYRAIQSYYVGNEGHIKTFVGGYHYFGDPTTKFWTNVPKNITVTHASKIYILDNFNLKDMNISEGVATLYNKSNDKIVGKSSISASSANIEVDQSSVENGDTLIFTITSHNFRPYQIELVATSDNTSNKKIKSNITDICKISLNGIDFPINKNFKNIKLSIYSINGRKVLDYKFNKLSKNINLNLQNLSKGIYIAKLNSNRNTLFNRMITIF